MGNAVEMRVRESEGESETTSDSIDGTWKFNWFWFWTNSLKFLLVSRVSLLFCSPPYCLSSCVECQQWRIQTKSSKFHTPSTTPNSAVSQTSTRRQTKWNQQTKMLIKSERDIFSLSLSLPLCIAVFNLCVCQCVAMNVNFINEVPEWQVTHTHTHVHSCTVNKYHQ